MAGTGGSLHFLEESSLDSWRLQPRDLIQIREIKSPKNPELSSTIQIQPYESSLFYPLLMIHRLGFVGGQLTLFTLVFL